MGNKELIQKFYTSFSEGNAAGMVACYHDEVVFEDPAFGQLKGERAKKMWEMLLSKKGGAAKISFDQVHATADSGAAHWLAEYTYGKQNRKVINRVEASFKFKEGKIIEHIDSFDLWKWTQQAMGLSGYLLGWSSFIKTKIQQTTKAKLDAFLESQSSQ
ncbi:nuclear transport factor 2 family protein [Echinicola pacifica]|nr:nuclear transport factor 2 family protein [Echinicola pacifica]